MVQLKREGVEEAPLQETHLTNWEHEKLKFNQYSSSCGQERISNFDSE